MGMDIYGEKPSSKVGEYFRNNAWHWRPLWDYTLMTCGKILTLEDARMGHYNDGHLIPEEKALDIAEALECEVESGRTLKYQEKRQRELEAMPDEVCELCAGTGKREDMEVPSGCNGCLGKGKVRPTDTWYPFDVENVKEFIRFCRASGGFKIC